MTNRASAYFSPSLLNFFPSHWKDDGTYAPEQWPADAILLDEETAETFWRQAPPVGKQLGAVGGLPAWVDIPPPPPLTRDEVEANRLRAYSNPLTGSDRLFAEASRMQLMGEDDFEDVRATAIARHVEIQAAHPWP